MASRKSNAASSPVTPSTDAVPEASENNNQYGSRRSSYFGEYSIPSRSRLSQRRSNLANDLSGHDQNRNSGAGYYGERRADSYYNGPPRNNAYGRRMVSEGAIPTQGRPYQVHGYHQSNDTMATGGSDSTGPWNSNTDPSSENSSIDRNIYGQQQQGNGYGYGYSPPIMEEGGAGSAYGGGPVQAPNGGARRPIPLGNSGDPPVLPPGKLPSTSRAAPEKKKGWLKRTFSKKD